MAEDEDDFIPLNATVMIAVCGRHGWDTARKLLLEAGIIEIDHEYKHGKKSKGYRLTEHWRENAKWKLSDDFIDYPVVEGNPKLEGWSLDKEKAKAAIALRYADNKQRFEAWSNIIDNIENHQYFTIGSTKREFHTFNGLPKESRSAILYNGLKTLEPDISNCQPLLLASLCKDNAYKKSVESGKFYDDYAKEALVDKETFKKVFLVWMGGGGGEEAMEDFMRGKFPIMARYVIKERDKNHKGLICKLQKMEAEIITTCPNSLSIHDGVRVSEGNLQAALDHIKAGFAKLGLTPKIVVGD